MLFSLAFNINIGYSLIKREGINPIKPQIKEMAMKANEIKSLIAKAEESGGSIEEIKSAVSQWDEKAKSVEIKENGEIVVDGENLSDKEVEQWFWWSQGAARKRGE